MKIGKVFMGLAAVAAAVSTASQLHADQSVTKLAGHVPQKLIAKSVDLGSADPTQTLSLTIPLQPRHRAELEKLIQRLYTPGDSLYGHYLTSPQFAARFAPTQAQYDRVVEYLHSRGLYNIKTSANRLVVNVSGSVSDVEKAFAVEFHRYYSADRRNVFATRLEPSIDAAISPLIYGVVGMNSFVKPHRYFIHSSQPTANPPGDGPNGGGLTGANIKTAYNLTTLNQTGAGQTLALAEFDGYSASDVTTYAQFNNLPHVQLKNVLIDGADGTPSTGQNSGAVEVTLDIELMAAIAPGATIMVYEAPAPTTDASFETEVVDVYSRIASDNLAKAVSTSWGSAEDQMQSATIQAENTAFMQMAAQGQSMYAAAGDAGAYDDGTSLSVDDPGSQPYVTSAGGTHLNLTSSLTYQGESSWNTSTVSSSNGPEGGGGGISTVWPIPSWQIGLGTTTNQGSSTHRMIPDLALDADPESGYSIYFSGQWGVVGGTSCVGPIMAAFTGLVNQARATNGKTEIGYINPLIYQIGTTSAYTQNFNDVNDGSTNLFYPAVSGYDLSTGWGSIIGAKAFNTLIGMNSSQ